MICMFRAIFLTGSDILLMVEKSIRGGISRAIHWYRKTNNKYMKAYDKNKKRSYLKYWDINNLYGWAMSQKLHGIDFKWVKDISKFNESFIKSSNEESDEGYFLEVDIKYPENIHELHNDLPFLPERMKTVRWKIWEVEKLVANFDDKMYNDNIWQKIQIFLITEDAFWIKYVCWL